MSLIGQAFAEKVPQQTRSKITDLKLKQPVRRKSPERSERKEGRNKLKSSEHRKPSGFQHNQLN